MMRHRCDKNATCDGRDAIRVRHTSYLERKVAQRRFKCVSGPLLLYDRRAFYERFYERLKRVRIVNFIVKMGFALGFALGLPLNDKKQIVPIALWLPLDFAIFTPL